MKYIIFTYADFKKNKKRNNNLKALILFQTLCLTPKILTSNVEPKVRLAMSQVNRKCALKKSLPVADISDVLNKSLEENIIQIEVGTGYGPKI